MPEARIEIELDEGALDAFVACPDGPLAGFLNAMTFRFLAPIRRMIPPVGGTLDLSPLILIVLIQILLVWPIPLLEGAIRSLFRS